jgi:uncharacterized protein YndB with AHSA1/START domain
MELHLTAIPVASAGMLIRKPADDVYEAFVNPDITTKFWFTKSSGRLESGKSIRWDWEMYGASTMVEVKELEPGKRILVEWDVDTNPTKVEWIFTVRTPDTTFVSITNSGFSGDGDKIVEQVMGSTSGFELVLAGLKAYLEHGIMLNLVEDRFPDQLVKRPTVR